MPIIKSTLQAAQQYADFSKLTKGKPTHVATLIHGDNEVTQKQLDTLKTLKVFKSQIQSGALLMGDTKTQKAKEQAELEAKAKEQAELEAQKALDEAKALAEKSEGK